MADRHDELAGRLERGVRAKACTLAETGGLNLIQAEVWVFIVNETGLASYANSQLGRSELTEYSVPGRMAIS